MIDGGRLALLRLSSNKIMMRTPPLRTAAESLADVQSTGAKNISSITQCRSHLLLLLRIFECRLRLETTSLPSARSPLSWPRFPVPLSMSLPQPMAPADCTTRHFEFGWLRPPPIAERVPQNMELLEPFTSRFCARTACARAEGCRLLQTAALHVPLRVMVDYWPRSPVLANSSSDLLFRENAFVQSGAAVVGI